MPDRLIANIQEIENTLRVLGSRPAVKAVLLSRQNRQFCEQEIRAATVEGVEFTVLPDIAEVLRSGEVFDVAILCCHLTGEEAALFELRQSGLAALYGVWFWDNHHHHHVNMRVAMLADLVFVSHWHNRHYLNLPAVLPATHIPAYSRHWSPGAIAFHYPDGLPIERRNALFGGFGRYVWAVERNRFIEALAAACPDNSLTLGKIDTYFQISAAEQLKAWTAHKVQLIVPINHDVSSRLFGALLTGQIPLVPDDVPDLNNLLNTEIQATLPILRYQAGEVASAEAAWRQGLKLFDAEGAAGVRRRHEFAARYHSLPARLADFAAFIRRPGPFKLVGDGRTQLWDRWR